MNTSSFFIGRWRRYGLVVAVCGVAFALRLRAAHNDLWLDEIWSLQLAESVTSAARVFCGLHHDNNHYLITLWMWSVGTTRQALIYRWPSILAGSLTVYLAGRVAHPWGRAAQTITMALFASSFLMIHYGSEARGYALAVMWALSAHLCLRSFLAHQTPRTAVVFGACVLLGFLSHLTFLQYYLAAIFWSVPHVTARHQGWRKTLRELLLLHLIPVCGLLSLYAVDIRWLQYGGGPSYPLWPVLLRAASLASGGPISGAATWIAAAALLAAVCWGLKSLFDRGSDEWKCFACGIFLFPLVQLCVLPPATVYERFYLLNIALALLLAGLALGTWVAGRHWQAALATVAILGFLVGNLGHVALLYRDGRGNYLVATQQIRTMSHQSPVLITSDHDFRNRLMLQYYASQTDPPLDMEYISLDEATRADWLLVHRWPSSLEPESVPYVAADGSPLPTLVVSDTPFAFVASFPSAKLSGCQWLLFRRVTNTTSPPTIARYNRELKRP